jgi:hypothetical protein
MRMEPERRPYRGLNGAAPLVSGEDRSASSIASRLRLSHSTINRSRHVIPARFHLEFRGSLLESLGLQ